MRVVKMSARRITLILIRIRQYRSALTHSTRHLIQRIRSQQVIMVQQPIIIPCGKLYRTVCVLCDAKVLFQLHIPYAGILIAVHGLLDYFGGAAVRDDKLPVFVRLSYAALYQGLHIHALCLICRYENGKLQFGRLCLCALSLQRPSVRHAIRIISVVLCCHALPRCDDCLPVSVFSAVINGLFNILCQ